MSFYRVIQGGVKTAVEDNSFISVAFDEERILREVRDTKETKSLDNLLETVLYGTVKRKGAVTYRCFNKFTSNHASKYAAATTILTENGSIKGSPVFMTSDGRVDFSVSKFDIIIVSVRNVIDDKLTDAMFAYRVMGFTQKEQHIIDAYSEHGKFDDLGRLAPFNCELIGCYLDYGTDVISHFDDNISEELKNKLLSFAPDRLAGVKPGLLWSWVWPYSHANRIILASNIQGPETIIVDDNVVTREEPVTSLTALAVCIQEFIASQIQIMTDNDVFLDKEAVLTYTAEDNTIVLKTSISQLVLKLQPAENNDVYTSDSYASSLELISPILFGKETLEDWIAYLEDGVVDGKIDRYIGIMAGGYKERHLRFDRAAATAKLSEFASFSENA